jgi:hypothetical protein
MANGFNFVNNLSRHIGQTVTIFTTSGGESGRGFTGILASVNCNFVRLITQIGPAPGCALGNCCDNEISYPRNNVGRVGSDRDNYDVYNELAACRTNNPTSVQGVQNNNMDSQRRINCNGNNGLGSIVDIPINKIASFVHNALGSEGW